MIGNELAIVMALIEKNKERMTINRLSEELNIDYKNVYTIVKRLEKDDLVFLEKIGRGYHCVLNKKVHPTIFEAEYQRREKILKKTILK
ncbi:MAG: winged helix-turn-helix domain-containing protein [Methanobacterium sp.]